MSPANKILRVVFDTNVLISAFAFTKDSPPFKVLELARLGKIEAFISSFILQELSKNLRDKMSWDEDRVYVLRKNLKTFLFIIKPSCSVDVIKAKKDDNRILECALSAKADVLVTGNMKHIRSLGHFQGIVILTPREFLLKYFMH